jgi:endonuclease YncB( thermonuclease family)
MTARQIFLGLTLAATAALAAACAKPQTLFTASDTAAVQAPPPAIEVLNADVIVVDGQHVRLVDAVMPQPAPRAHCAAEALAAYQGRLKLKELSQGVQKVTITAAGAADSSGRTPAHVLFDGNDPAQSLIDDGLAVAANGKPMDWCGPLSGSLPQATHIAMLSEMGE